MTSAEIIAYARELAKAGRPFLFSTVDEAGRPQSRWMGGLTLAEPFEVCLMSMTQARKMGQIRGNAAGQLVFTTPDFARVITVSGTCEITEDAAVKQGLWDAMPMIHQMLSGPEDERMGAIKFTGSHIELFALQEFGPVPVVAEI
jgi:general stress protein 26